jgi:uncharacterized protein YgiM (DUF1202 family)
MSKMCKVTFFTACLFLSACATNMPTDYGNYVEITSGPYKGERGQLVGDCSGFEYYRVRLNNGRHVCERSWNMTRTR